MALTLDERTHTPVLLLVQLAKSHLSPASQKGLTGVQRGGHLKEGEGPLFPLIVLDYAAREIKQTL